jgi:hypothetical protein
MGAIQCGSGDRRGGGKLCFGIRRQGKEGLTRGAHQNRILQLRQLRQTRQNLGILFLALSESKTGIEHNRQTVYPRPASPADGGVQILGDSHHYIGNRPELRPGLRGSAHVVQDEAGIVLDNRLGQQRVPRKAARVVDDFGAVLQSEFGHLGLIGID